MQTLLIIIIAFSGSFLLLLLLPLKGVSKYEIYIPSKRFHEADSVLSRRKLVPGSERYKAYYRLHPEYRKPDDLARSAPGLLSPDSKYYDPATFNAADSNFHIVEHLAKLINGKKAEQIMETSPREVTGFLSGWLTGSGAHSVGFTRLKDYHLYSHKGRGERSGEPVVNNHSFAIAISVEMDYRMMKSAPYGSTVMESSEQYLRSGILAIQTAGFIRKLGYDATAHIDGNYEVICPLVAADAGLGMIGRMGLLMTPRLGPRVRISVVTTSIPLMVAPPEHDLSMLDFCTKCKKCATVCPVQAIPSGSRKDHDGIKRWRINPESCYHYWTVSGTDCGRCVVACPYSHPDNWFHTFVRWGVKNNLFFRQLAVKLDDLIYGRKPRIHSLPDWIHIA